MRICIPLQHSEKTEVLNDASLLATHFGLVDRFVVLESDSGEIVDECEITGRCAGPCRCPLPDFAERKIDAFAGQSIGYRLLQMTHRAGLPVLAVKARTLGELRQEIRNHESARPLQAAICLTSLCCQEAGDNH